MKRIFLIMFFVGISAPSHAQLAVIDPANLATLIKLVDQTIRTIEVMQQQKDLVDRISQSRLLLAKYRLSGLSLPGLLTQRYPAGAPWITGMNSGDPYGDLYYKVVQPMLSSSGVMSQMSPEAQRIMQATIATIEVLDSTSIHSAHAGALARGYDAQLNTKIEAYQNDVIGGSHELTAVLDKLSAGSLLARRSAMSQNQVLGAILDSQIAAAKTKRDAQVNTVNSQINMMRQYSDVMDSLTSGTTSALQNWQWPQ